MVTAQIYPTVWYWKRKSAHLRDQLNYLQKPDTFSTEDFSKRHSTCLKYLTFVFITFSLKANTRTQSSSTWPCKALSSACGAAVLLSSTWDEGPCRWHARGISVQRNGRKNPLERCCIYTDNGANITCKETIAENIILCNMVELSVFFTRLKGQHPTPSTNCTWMNTWMHSTVKTCISLHNLILYKYFLSSYLNALSPEVRFLFQCK